NGGNQIASTLMGVPNAVDVRPLILDYDYRWKSGALCVQNDWKVRPNLTLNLGLRYSLQYPREEKHNVQGVLRPDRAQAVALTDTNRSPNPDFGGFVNVSTLANGSAAGGTGDATQPINLSRNPVLQGTTGTLDSILGTDSGGLVFLKSLGINAFATGGANPNGKVATSHNW